MPALRHPAALVLDGGEQAGRLEHGVDPKSGVPEWAETPRTRTSGLRLPLCAVTTALPVGSPITAKSIRGFVAANTFAPALAASSSATKTRRSRPDHSPRDAARRSPAAIIAASDPLASQAPRP